MAVTPQQLAVLLRQGQQMERDSASYLQPPRQGAMHWTQGLAGVLGGVGGNYMQTSAAQQEGEQQKLAAELLGDMYQSGDASAAMQNPWAAEEARKFQAQAPQREFQQWKMGQAKANAPLERRQLELANQYRQAQINAANKAAQPKPKWTKIGRDSMGQDIYGWVDPATRQVIPQTLPGVQPARTPDQGQIEPGKPGSTFSLGDPPPGVDPAEYRKYASRRAAESVVAARQSYPGVAASVERMNNTISGIVNSPAWDRSTSVITGPLLSVSEDAKAFDDMVEQVRGGAFVQAFQDIKGGGAITETEGRAATQALARLQRASVGSENFKKALTDFQKELKKLQKIAAWKAGYEMPDDQGPGVINDDVKKRADEILRKRGIIQ